MKLGKKVFIGALAAGFLMGGTGLLNVSAANAAPGPGNQQPIINFQAEMGAQGQWDMGRQSGTSNQKQYVQQQPVQQEPPVQWQPVQQQPVQWPSGQQQTVQWQQMFNKRNAQGGQMLGAVGGNIISQVADILDVEEETIIEALQDGQSLVEIAGDYDVDEDELLDELVELQSDAIDNAVDEDILTDNQADELKEQLAEQLEQIVESINTTFMNNRSSFINYDDTSVSNIEDTLDDYFEDAGDDYFSDDGIDVTISLDGDEDDLAYKVTLDFDDAEDYDDLTDISQTKLKTFLNAVKSKINTEIDDTNFEDADITGKAVDKDHSSYYVKYNGSSYTYSWDD